MSYLYRQTTDPTNLGCIRLLLRTILDCYKPLENEKSYWKSFKDENNVWIKKKVQLTEEEIADKIFEKRMFLSEHKLIKMIDGETITGCLINKKRLLYLFDEYLKSNCDYSVYYRIIKEAKIDDPAILDE